MTQFELTPEQVASWQGGADGFLNWIKAVQPRIPSSENKFIVFKPEPFQVEVIRKALARKRNGHFKYITIAISMPRRHSKTVLVALLCLWRLCTRPNENIVACANSERQITSGGFELCRKIVLSTPALLQQIGRKNVQQYQIEVPALGGTLRTVSGNVAGLYGEKITCAWVSEIHAAASDEAMQVLASSLGDSLNSWMLIDSTVDGQGGPLHHLEQLQESGEDATVFVHRLEYRDLDEALRKSPSWINRGWLKSRAVQLTPMVFASQHLNQRQASEQNLFALQHIEACTDRLPMPFTLDDLTAIAQGKTFVTGGGLDRAYFASLHGDATIWTSVAKVAGDPGEEPHFYVLNQQNIIGSLGVLIKKAIQGDHDTFNFMNVCIEAYNSQDIATWAMERGIPCEIIHATSTAQIPAFTDFHRIVAEGRLHFSDKLDGLAKEMKTFLYELKGDQPRFGISKKFHDDRVYSLAWAIHSLRQQELASFTLENVICKSRSCHADCCYLRGGDLILSCSESCKSHIDVQQMYNQYRHSNVETDISLPTFFINIVTVDGIHLYA